MGLIVTAEQMLRGRPRPKDEPLKGRGGRPLKYGSRKCKLPICPRKHWGHGYCRPHGRKFLLYGDPLWVKGQPVRCTCTRCPVHNPDLVPMRPTRKPPGPRGRPAKQTHCDTPECPRPHHGNGLCKTCGRTKAKWGDARHVYVPTRTGRCGCDKHKG